MQYARWCKAYQVHAYFIPELIHPKVASWQFEAWGIEVVGPISPSLARGHWFNLAITDYFSKGMEAKLIAEVKTINVINFFKLHVIRRYGVLKRIIHGNVPNLRANHSTSSTTSIKFRM